MKYINKIILTLLVGFLLTTIGCEDFLDRYPKDTPSPGNFFVNEETAMKTAMAGISRIQFHLSGAVAMRGGNYMNNLDRMTDDQYSRSNSAAWYGWDLTPTTSQFWKYWAGYYNCIASCNYAIEGIPTSSDPNYDENAQKRAIAVAHFVRSWIYSNIVGLWGSAPLIISVPASKEEYYQPKATQEAILLQMIEDFKYAKDNLPDSWPGYKGAPTKAAGAGYLAKAYLMLADYYKYEKNDASSATSYFDLAKQAGEQAVSIAHSAGFQLGNYKGMMLDANQASSPEILWSVQFAQDVPDYGNSMNVVRNIRDIDGPFKSIHGSGWGYCLPQRNLIDEYESDDRRLEYTVWKPGDFYGIYHGAATVPIDYWYINEATGDTTHTTKSYVDGDTVRYSYKWSPCGTNIRKGNFDPAVDYLRSGEDFVMMRLADLYLLTAEACAETGDDNNALKYVNMVRARGDVDLPARALNDGRFGDGSIIDIVRHERRIELAFEGIRLFDMARWGLLKTYKQRGENHEIKRHYYSDLLPESNEAKWDIPYGTPGPGLWPIPQKEIDQNDAMTQADQNPGYN